MTQDFTNYDTGDIIDCLPMNRPLIKNSGLWYISTDDGNNVYIAKRHNELFRDFILRYTNLLHEFEKDEYDSFLIDLALNKTPKS